MNTATRAHPGAARRGRERERAATCDSRPRFEFMLQRKFEIVLYIATPYCIVPFRRIEGSQ
jgi:hypothetical protein